MPQGGARRRAALADAAVSNPCAARSRRSASRADDAFGLIPFWDRAACRDKLAATRNEGLYTPPSTKGTLDLSDDRRRGELGRRRLRSRQSDRLCQHLACRAHRHADPGGADGRLQGACRARLRTAARSRLRHDARGRAVAARLALQPPPWGVLVAVDLKAGKISLAVARSARRRTSRRSGCRSPSARRCVNGVLVTAGGLVFTRRDGRLPARFDAKTGAELWQGRLPVPGVANPMTYRGTGEQYVVIAAGGHSEAGTSIGDSVVAFRPGACGRDPSPCGHAPSTVRGSAVVRA